MNYIFYMGHLNSYRKCAVKQFVILAWWLEPVCLPAPARLGVRL